MADLCNTYQSVLKKLEDFLKTEETEKRLTTLREMSEILASTIAEKGNFEGEESEVDKCLVLILELCGTLLFGPYTAFLIQVSLKSNMVNEIEKKQKEEQSSALPKFMQAKYDQIKRYLEKAKGQLKKIDDMLPELVKKVREARKNKFKIPDEELEDLNMDIEDVNCELDECKNYLKEADDVLSMLDSDINSEVWKYGIKLVGATGAAAGISAGIILGGATFAPTQIGQVVQCLGAGGSIAAVGLAVSLLLGIWYTIDNYNNSFKNHVADLKMEMHGLKTEYRNMESKIKKRLVDRMKASN